WGKMVIHYWIFFAGYYNVYVHEPFNRNIFYVFGSNECHPNVIHFHGHDASDHCRLKSVATVMNAIRMLSISMVMMPVTTAGLNQLPPQLIPHGSAMNNTFRQVSGAIGTALLVTIMSTSAIPTDGVDGLIRGVNISFIVAGFISVIG